MADDYFDEAMVNRQRLLWVVATRRQLERWEASLAAVIRSSWTHVVPDLAGVWSAEIERHLALVAARNLLHALDLPPASSLPIDPNIRADLIEGRNVHEHWTDHLPVFSVTPRAVQPERSGKAFADRNPESDPFSFLGFGNKTGARLLPNVSTSALHDLLDAVEAEVLANDPELGEHLPPRAPSPWTHEGGEWWPKPEDD